MQRTHRKKPNRPERAIVTNKPSTEESKPWPRHTVLPARESRPLLAVGKEVPKDVIVAEFRDDGGYKDVVMKVFVLVGAGA